MCRAITPSTISPRRIRAIGEPIHQKRADEISMAKLLTLLFEVTELFDMRTRPELILLQKTMVVVEGVGRDARPAARHVVDGRSGGAGLDRAQSRADRPARRSRHGHAGRGQDDRRACRRSSAAPVASPSGSKSASEDGFTLSPRKHRGDRSCRGAARPLGQSRALGDRGDPGGHRLADSRASRSTPPGRPAPVSSSSTASARALGRRLRVSMTSSALAGRS